MISNPRQKFEQGGRRAERLASWLLRFKGYKILEMRYKTKLGEIDILARKGRVLVIVEVKKRPSLEAGHAALHRANLRRIEDAAALYQSRNTHMHDFDMRFDVIFVLPKFRFVHLQDAWRRY